LSPEQIMNLRPMVLTQYTYIPNGEVITDKEKDHLQAVHAYHALQLAARGRIREILEKRAALYPENSPIRRHIQNLIRFEFLDQDGHRLEISDSLEGPEKLYRFVIDEKTSARGIKLDQGFFGTEPLPLKMEDGDYNVVPVYSVNIAAIMIALDLNRDATTSVLKRLIQLPMLPGDLIDVLRTVKNLEHLYYRMYVAQAIEKLVWDAYVKVAEIVQKAIGGAA